MSDWGQLVATACLSCLCCLQPIAMLALGIIIGKYGGVSSAVGYLWRNVTAPKE